MVVGLSVGVVRSVVEDEYDIEEVDDLEVSLDCDVQSVGFKMSRDGLNITIQTNLQLSLSLSSSSSSLLLLLLLLFHDLTTQLKFLTAGKIVVSGNNKLPRNTKMFLFPVLYICNTFLSILADPSSADFWIKVIDVSSPISFKLPFNRNGIVSKAPNTIGTTLVFTSHILLSSLARF